MQSSVSSEPASRRRQLPRGFPFFRPVSIFAALVLGAGLALRVLPSAAEGVRAIPPPVLDEPANPESSVSRSRDRTSGANVRFAEIGSAPNDRSVGIRLPIAC
jgi:hypothetical protein